MPIVTATMLANLVYTPDHLTHTRGSRAKCSLDVHVNESKEDRMSFWDITDQYRMENRGRVPSCPKCGGVMCEQDDHGGFACIPCLLGGVQASSSQIPQVDTTGMSDAEKARIPPMNRLHAPPTVAEAAHLAALCSGTDAECESMRRALEKERGSE